MHKKEIDILGEKYTVETKTTEEEPILEECAAFCDTCAKSIIIGDSTAYCTDRNCTKNPSGYLRKVLRHEIIHAFLSESGLENNSEWAGNEEMIDWFALMIPKLNKVFKDNNCAD